MTTIRILSEEVITKIAAGEVIERPAYAVKEVLENALDAHATSIRIHVDDTHALKIHITDNGIGMNKDDLSLSWKLHATSKIQTADDLTRITHFGFRGEALASIAAMSTLTIESRTQDEPFGHQLVIERGMQTKIVQTGMPTGTRIVIEDLFGNVPARKQLLKNKRTEFRHIHHTVLQSALATPHVRWTLMHNHVVVFDLPPVTNDRDRITTLFGDDVSIHLLKLRFEDSYIKINGWIGRPQLTSGTNRKQFIFVNGRPVSDTLIASAVKEAFGTLIDRNAFPVFFLYLTVPFELADVNIHPRKEHIRFFDNKLVFDAIVRGVSETLQSNTIGYQSTGWMVEQQGEKEITKSHAATILREHLGTTAPQKIQLQGKDLVQLHHMYLVAPTQHGYIIIDQHAAHERILYEKLVAQFKTLQQRDLQHTLLHPVPIQLSSQEQQIIHEYETELQQLGFGWETNNTGITVTHVPSLYKDRDPVPILHEFIDDVIRETTHSLDSRTHKMLTYLACRSAIKAGDDLTKDAMRTLIEELLITPNNTACPHGRPTMVEMNLQELHILFKRT